MTSHTLLDLTFEEKVEQLKKLKKNQVTIVGEGGFGTLLEYANKLAQECNMVIRESKIAVDYYYKVEPCGDSYQLKIGRKPKNSKTSIQNILNK